MVGAAAASRELGGAGSSGRHTLPSFSLVQRCGAAVVYFDRSLSQGMCKDLQPGIPRTELFLVPSHMAQIRGHGRSPSSIFDLVIFSTSFMKIAPGASTMDSRAPRDPPLSQDDYCSSFRLADWLVEDAIDARSEQLTAPTPATTVIDAANDVITSHHSQARDRSGALPLLQLADWSEDRTYDERPPTCIHYSIEWKLTANGRVVAKDTEQNLVLAPSAYWEVVLRSKLDKLLRKKLPSNKAFRADDTNIVLSVTDRSERDLVKRFDELDIDWRVIEKQLEAWGHLFRAGKRLRMDISFNYPGNWPCNGYLNTARCQTWRVGLAAHVIRASYATRRRRGRLRPAVDVARRLQPDAMPWSALPPGTALLARLCEYEALQAENPPLEEHDQTRRARPHTADPR